MTRAEADADSELYSFYPFRFVAGCPNLVPQYKRQLRPDLNADRKHALLTIPQLPGESFVLVWSGLKQLVSVPLSDVQTLTVSDEILFSPHDLPPPMARFGIQLWSRFICDATIEPDSQRGFVTSNHEATGHRRT